VKERACSTELSYVNPGDRPIADRPELVLEIGGLDAV
jgi:hypothetical protein